MRRRVVITGAGVVSPIGAGVGPFWDALADGRTGAGRVEMEGVGTINAFPVLEGEDARERFGQRDARRMDRSGRLAAVAGAMALEDAGDLGLDSERVGISLGSVHGGAETLLEAHRAFLERGADRVGPLAIPLSLANHPCAAAARALGLRGPSAAPATACAAGSDAIGFALSVLRDGRAEAMVAGGADAPLSPLVIAGYIKVGALSTGTRPPELASRPFDLGRDGFVMGEGAGRAAARGARARAGARGAHLRRARRLRQLVRRRPPDRPRRDRRGPGPRDADRHRGRRADRRPTSATSTRTPPRRSPATSPRPAPSRSPAWGRRPSPPPSRPTATRSAAPAGWRPSRRSWRSRATRCPPPSTWRTPTPRRRSTTSSSRGPRTIGAAMSNSFGFGGHNACLVLTRHEG